MRKQFTCLGENTEKYRAFAGAIEKEVARIDKNGEEVTKSISCNLQFIDSTRFMAISLSNLVNNLSEGIRRTKCNTDTIVKNVKNVLLLFSWIHKF